MDQIPSRFLTIENIDLISTCLRMGYRLPASADPDVAVLMDFVQETGFTSFKSWQTFQSEIDAMALCEENLRRWLVWSTWCWMGSWIRTYPFLEDAEGWLRDTVDIETLLEEHPEYQNQTDNQTSRAAFVMLAIASYTIREVCYNLANVSYHEPEIRDQMVTRMQFLVRMEQYLPEAPVPDAFPMDRTQDTMEAGDLDMDGFMNDPDLPEGEITNRIAPDWP